MLTLRQWRNILPLKGGAAKAMKAMQKKYGAKKGKSIFYAKANKLWKGKKSARPDARARKTYKKGGKQK